MNLRDLILRPTTPAAKIKIAAILMPVGLLIVVGAFSFVENFGVAKVVATAGLCLFVGGLLSLSRYATDKTETKLRKALQLNRSNQSQELPGPPL